MAPRILAGLVLAASLTTACDEIAQKKPQTVSTIEDPVTAVSTVGRGAATSSVRAPGETGASNSDDAVPDARGVRLFGRGVNRHRQIRV